VAAAAAQNQKQSKELRIAVVLSGGASKHFAKLYYYPIHFTPNLGQAPGGHNVIAGVYDYMQQLSPSSVLLGFLDGPQGIYTGQYCILGV
jgi:hypothetical protein